LRPSRGGAAGLMTDSPDGFINGARIRERQAVDAKRCR
jgi:hypothetical protein